MRGLVYYNETRGQANRVCIIDIVVVHVTIVKVRVPGIVGIVLRRRPVVVAKPVPLTTDMPRAFSYCSTFENTKKLGGAITFIILNIFY